MDRTRKHPGAGNDNEATNQPASRLLRATVVACKTPLLLSRHLLRSYGSRRSAGLVAPVAENSTFDSLSDGLDEDIQKWDNQEADDSANE